MSPAKCYLIDVTARTITETTYDGAGALQTLIGGYIELAAQWDNGDVLYVDEEGLLKEGQRYFSVFSKRPDQPFAGNGVLVGREVEGEQYPGGYTTLDPTITIDQLRALVKFWENL